jgi:hypothetical protein
MKTDNKALYDIENDVERFILLSWSIIVLLGSLIGDSVILIGTIKYKAIRQHKIIITVIQHMAVCDLLQTVFRIFPFTLAFITDHWVLGQLLCHVEENIGWICGGSTIFLTCSMTTFKLIIIKRPLRAGTWTSTLGHMICGAMWLAVLGVYSPVLIVHMSYIRETI